jgi:transaldolase
VTIPDVRIKIFADGADLDGILRLTENPLIKGFTTNPTLMHRSGVVDYEGFARDVLAVVTELPVSFEVLADDFDEMARQARRIASWGDNVYVKIPITDTSARPSIPLVRELSSEGLRLNVTALLSLEQVRSVTDALDPESPAIVSVFAGRIADTGVDPTPLMAKSLNILSAKPLAELLWASPREILNVIQADELGCHIITVTNDILKKLDLVGKDLSDFSLDTVKMFYNDARKAGFQL